MGIVFGDQNSFDFAGPLKQEKMTIRTSQAMHIYIYAIYIHIHMFSIYACYLPLKCAPFLSLFYII